MRTKREPSGIFATRLSFPIARPVTVILCFTALSTKTEGISAFCAVDFRFRNIEMDRTSQVESCRNLVHFICDFTKKDRIHFYLTTPYISAFDTVQGRSFYSPVRWFISVSDFCSTLLQIRTGKRTSVFYADGSDCKTKYIRRFRSSVLRMYEILYDTVPLF